MAVSADVVDWVIVDAAIVGAASDCNVIPEMAAFCTNMLESSTCEGGMMFAITSASGDVSGIVRKGSEGTKPICKKNCK